MKTIPEGLLFVDKENQLLVVSYCCGLGWWSLPFLDDGLAEVGLPKATDCMLLLLVAIIPFRIASGSYVCGPTPGSEQIFFSEEH